MKYFETLFRQREEISVRYDHEDAAVWIYLNPKERPRLSFQLLSEIVEVNKAIVDFVRKSELSVNFPVRYVVITSQLDGIFSFGGDLEYFLELFLSGDREALHAYTEVCIELVYMLHTNLGLPLLTVAAVDGTALGGGFEMILSCSKIVATKSTKMGFPESRFNLFPGVGGYSFLSRMVGIKKAEEIIYNGNIMDISQLQRLHIVDSVAADDETIIQATKRLIRQEQKHFKSNVTLLQARQIYAGVDKAELWKIANLWMDLIFSLDEQSIRAIQRLVNAQNRKEIDRIFKRRTYQDRRIYHKGVTVNRRRGIDRRSA